jgi:predicted nucleotidyltransferase
MSKEILIRVNRDPLFGLSKEEYLGKVRACLKGKVEEAYIFGSLARGESSRFSDIDILIVCNTGLPFVERAGRFHELLDIVPSTDILVYTREEFKKIMESDTSPFWKNVKESMKRII